MWGEGWVQLGHEVGKEREGKEIREGGLRI